MPMDAMRQLLQLVALVEFRFPILTKDDFVSHMTEMAKTVNFNGIEYEMRFAANLVPAFFFPVEDLGDLLGKTTELLLSRGLVSAREFSTVVELSKVADKISADIQRRVT